MTLTLNMHIYTYMHIHAAKHADIQIHSHTHTSKTHIGMHVNTVIYTNAHLQKHTQKRILLFSVH